ncbi:hypothetical protein ACHAWO_012939 [Cyclotella atomus]|uniref:Uncharacterized protein n=1 Tax=Cyclotella atomus TaxID=382360 RepID=A0ABD3P8M5_9STRA
MRGSVSDRTIVDAMMLPPSQIFFHRSLRTSDRIGPYKFANMSKTTENLTKTVKKTTKPKWDKKDPRGPRPSPTVSAAEQDLGTVMTGNDGNQYIVKASEWTEVSRMDNV